MDIIIQVRWHVHQSHEREFSFPFALLLIPNPDHVYSVSFYDWAIRFPPFFLPSLDLYILDVRESPVMESAAEIPDRGCLSVDYSKNRIGQMN